MSFSADNSLLKRPAWVLWLVALVLIYHSCAVLQTLIPDWGLLVRINGDSERMKAVDLSPTEREELVENFRKASLFPPSRPLDSIFLNYRILSGTRQDWQMFHAPPRDEKLEIVLEARDSNGAVHVLGPILPGFEIVDTLKDARYYQLWSRYEFWNETSYTRTYLENVGRLLKQSKDPVYKDVKLVYRKHLIKPLDDIANSGEISKVAIREWWLPRDAWPDDEG
ncbi:MAG: hypothetical protein ACI9R3_005127 [Verrucomicrobiales bacterium]|jgi:hypothetical protein